MIISISIEDSPTEIIAGIPISVVITANVPSTIFYTFDGTTPNFDSNIVIGPLKIPTNSNYIVLKILATDGINFSDVIEKVYKNQAWKDDRMPHDKVIGLSCEPLPGVDLGPFGSASPTPRVKYGDIGGITVDEPGIPGIPDGYDGHGGIADYTDLPLSDYDIIYSTTNSRGETGKGIGNMPATVTFPPPVQKTISSDANSPLFNPKAFVIFQDGTTEPFDPDRPMINRQFFSIGDLQVISDGTAYTTTAYEGNELTGSLVKPFYNHREGTYTFYYFDSKSLRWIISKEPFKAKDNSGSLANVVWSERGVNARKVFKWFLFKRQVL